MKPLALNLKNAKKTASDEHSSTFSLPSGHQIRVLHAPLSALQRKQIQAMPIHKMADGGDATPTQSEIDEAKQSNFTPPAPGEPWEVGDGGYRVNPDILNQEIANRAPASLGTADYQKMIDDANAKRAERSQAIGDTLGKAWNWLIHGPQSAQPAPAAAPEQTLLGGASSSSPPPSSSSDAASSAKDLPDFGEPVSMPNPGAAQRTPGSPAPSNIPGVSIGGIYQTGLQGINAEQQAESQAGQERLNADKMYAAQQAAEEANWEAERQSKMQDIQSAIDDVKRGVIQPNHYLENQNAGQKVATAIGLILGGAGAHSTGGQNMALTFLNDQINRDIASQRENQENNLNVLGAYQSKYKDSVAAEQMARATQYGIYASKLQQAADATADPLAKARALQAKSQLQGQILPLVNQANAIQMLNARAQQKAQNPGAFSQSPVDMAAMNTLQRTGLMPAADVEAATKEAAQVGQARELRNDYVNAFNQLNQKALAGAMTPGDRAAFVNVLGAKLSKMATNRYNAEENKQLVEGMFPGPAEWNQTRKDKFQQGLKYFDSLESGTPTLDRYGLKNPAPQPAPAQHAVGDIVRVRGQKMQIINKNGDLKPVS